jgi:hypothetical protein
MMLGAYNISGLVELTWTRKPKWMRVRIKIKLLFVIARIESKRGGVVMWRAFEKDRGSIIGF